MEEVYPPGFLFSWHRPLTAQSIGGTAPALFNRPSRMARADMFTTHPVIGALHVMSFIMKPMPLRLDIFEKTYLEQRNSAGSFISTITGSAPGKNMHS